MLAAGRSVGLQVTSLFLNCSADAVGAQARMANSRSIVYTPASDYDAIFVCGGYGITWDGAFNRELKRLLEDSLVSGRIVAAVGHGPCSLVTLIDQQGRPFIAGKQVNTCSFCQWKTYINRRFASLDIERFVTRCCLSTWISHCASGSCCWEARICLLYPSPGRAVSTRCTDCATE